MLNVKILKVQIATPPVVTRVSLGGLLQGSHACPVRPGLKSQDLWLPIVALGGHPCLRPQTRPVEQSQRSQARDCVTGPEEFWVVAGAACPDDPLACARVVLPAVASKEPWLQRTNTPPAQTCATR